MHCIKTSYHILKYSLRAFDLLVRGLEAVDDAENEDSAHKDDAEPQDRPLLHGAQGAVLRRKSNALATTCRSWFNCWPGFGCRAGTNTTKLILPSLASSLIVAKCRWYGLHQTNNSTVLKKVTTKLSFKKLANFSKRWLKKPQLFFN